MISPTAKRRLEALLAKRRPLRHRRSRVVALCYHSVAPEGALASTDTDVFSQHLRWLRDQCRVVPFSQLLEHSSGESRERPVVAITFDDGYVDNYVHAFPALAELDLPATFFVATGLVDRDETTIDRFARLWRVAADEIQGLTWDQIAEMRSAGMKFGAHTHSHPNLRRIAPTRVVAEASTSKRQLEDHLHEAVKAFAYPFGDVRWDFSRRTMELVRGLGFEFAAAMQLRGVKQNDDPMNLPRFPVLNDPLEVLEAKVDGRLDLLGIWREWMPRWLSGLMSSGPTRAREARHGASD